ncbi:hypothetical protein K491DRAFT_220105 [Lophiostoma macrostomum CBS 122681]|uniref:Uncharacterized protein n=1 Tax=Lophiostoma macrostomum CBS 122681 TaxID=1314788 RepID=A0A6A6SMG6_9PLEO|nr:hypothetical protein K491DRAFT_220105 [Lophiostoma macrostomum CBS 122681]
MKDTPDNRERNPEAFIWTCCEKPGNALSCERTRQAYANLGHKLTKSCLSTVSQGKSWLTAL